MRVTTILIVLALVGGVGFIVLVFGGVLAVGWFTQKNLTDMANKGAQLASGYPPAKTPAEAMSSFQDAVQKRRYKFAASYCTKPYADMLTRAHDAASEWGSTIDDIRDRAKAKGVYTDRAAFPLFMLDPFPNTITADKAPVQKGDTKAIGKYSWKLPTFKNANIANDPVFKPLDLTTYNHVLGPSLVFMNEIELVKEGEEWKLNIPTIPSWEKSVDLFIERSKLYPKELGALRIRLENDRYDTPEKFENEVIQAIRDAQPR